MVRLQESERTISVSSGRRRRREGRDALDEFSSSDGERQEGKEGGVDLQERYVRQYF